MDRSKTTKLQRPSTPFVNPFQTPSFQGPYSLASRELPSRTPPPPPNAVERSAYGRRSFQIPPGGSSSSTAEKLPPPLPNRPCEACESASLPTFFCVNCDGSFCDECWDKERPHRSGKLGPDGFPHEKADPRVVNRLKETFKPPDNPVIQRRMHIEDEDTTWFGIARDQSNAPVFTDYGRYSTLMVNSSSGESARYPQLVSFIGQTGAGKSTLVKMLIEQQRILSDPAAQAIFPTPIPGSVRNDNVPTSGDVHLYADPATYLGHYPMLYADCEGLEGGENIPISLRHREGQEHGQAKKRSEAQEDVNNRDSRGDSRGDQNKLKKRWKMPRGSQRDIAWANSPETQKRQYAVTELYPRLLYTFSDVIVFVLQNPKIFEATVLSKLLNWASSSMEKSLNQPTLPHAIIALNATDLGVDEKEWDCDHATQTLMSTVAGAITRDAKYEEYADYWTRRGKTIRTMKDLLECYYSSVRVVRIPKKGRYMLIDEQVTKLHHEITTSCNQSYYAKRKARILSNSDELHVYLQSAFDHFSQNLDTPFNFIEVAFKNNPIPLDFGGNILKLAVAVKNTGIFDNGPRIFRELSSMVASCIVLDCVRHNLRGPTDVLFQKYYRDYCDYALQDFCGLFWPCEYQTRRGRCVNVQEGHTKGHQNSKGNIIGTGSYTAAFTWEFFEDEWVRVVQEKVQYIQAQINDRLLQDRQLNEGKLTSKIHRQTMQDFYRRLGGAHKFNSHSTCFCCLREMPEHPLPCGHVLCWPCVSAYGTLKRGSVMQVECCPLHPSDAFRRPWMVNFKPDLAGVRILSLDGGGIRGIVELEVLREIERFMGDKIPIQLFFDLIVGTSTGGIIALGLGVKRWSVQECIAKFERFSHKAFTPRLGGVFGSFGTRYKTRPMEEALQEAFDDNCLFGGQQDEASSYFIKVAVTASTDTGQQPVIFTNYNRQPDSQGLYHFVRPDEAEHEMKIWEAARATSAAPTYFKPFVNKRTNEGYLDGAVFYNNPARIAYFESKALWQDVEDCHPDILLSLGTAHNGKDSIGSIDAGARFRSQLSKPNSTAPDPQSERQRGIGLWFRNVSVVQFWNVMVNRVDNMLSSEQLWNDFRTWVLDSNASEGRRYMRINPQLGYRPPRLDEKNALESLKTTVIEKLRRNEGYRSRIAKIAHRLIASCFYFEKRDTTEGDDGAGTYHLCKGKIRCRFSNGSNELRDLGNFLSRHQTPNFQPFFRIQEKHREHLAVSKVLTPDIVQSMITMAEFSMSPITVHVSNKLGATAICLGLINVNIGKEDVHPISGFPRVLVVDHLKRSSSSDTTLHETIRDPSKRQPSRRNHSVSSTPGVQPAGLSPKHQRSASGSIQPFPNSADNVNDWVLRRQYAPSRTQAPVPVEMPSTTSLDSSPSHPKTSGSTQIPPYLAPGPVFELPAGNSSSSTTSDERDDVDEEESALATAIALSLAESEKNLNRYTMGGTNIIQLTEALERSMVEQ